MYHWQGEGSSEPASFIIPDFFPYCNFPLSYNVHGDEVARESDEWLNTNCPNLTNIQRRNLGGLHAGQLAAYCYNTASRKRLRVVSDFLNYLFHLDNISDGMSTRETRILANVVMNAIWFNGKFTSMPNNRAGHGKEQTKVTKNYLETLLQDFWGRCIPDCGPGVKARFKETLLLYFEAINIQAQARDQNIVPDLESYIVIRRDTSVCKPCSALIEYALDIDLPDFVVKHPIIKALNQATNDFVTWSNDIFSYNKEQARGDTYNMIHILLKYHDHSLQSAVDYVGELCMQSIDTFSANKKQLPSWGPEIDHKVARYVKGLQDWIVGSLHWSFESTRYFGTNGMEIKYHRVIRLLPLKRGLKTKHQLSNRSPPSFSLSLCLCSAFITMVLFILSTIFSISVRTNY